MSLCWQNRPVAGGVFRRPRSIILLQVQSLAVLTTLLSIHSKHVIAMGMRYVVAGEEGETEEMKWFRCARQRYIYHIYIYIIIYIYISNESSNIAQKLLTKHSAGN